MSIYSYHHCAKLTVFAAGQKRRVTPAIRREMRRRSAIEPVIGHIKSEHRMDRNYLADAQGDPVNAILAAAGYNFLPLLRRLKMLFVDDHRRFSNPAEAPPCLKPQFVHGR